MILPAQIKMLVAEIDAFGKELNRCREIPEEALSDLRRLFRMRIHPVLIFEAMLRSGYDSMAFEWLTGKYLVGEMRADADVLSDLELLFSAIVDSKGEAGLSKFLSSPSVPKPFLQWRILQEAVEFAIELEEGEGARWLERSVSKDEG